MGACLSCLGLGRREYNDAESSRLLDDDLYPGSYGYGSVNNAHQNHSDPEDARREREALEAICQRASDSVVDIWALQPQPHLQPQATLPSNNGSASSSRAPSAEISAAIAETSDAPATSQKAPTSVTQQQKLAAVPKNWGEVVISPSRKGKERSSRSATTDNGIFGVLKVT